MKVEEREQAKKMVSQILVVGDDEFYSWVANHVHVECALRNIHLIV
jgi:hypothetical protein